MRVVMAANWWYRRGGLGAVMLDEAAGLEARGHEVVPFAAAHPDNVGTPWSRYFPPFLELSDDGRGLGPAAKAEAALDIVHNRAAARAFRHLLDDVRPDIVHIHNPSRQLSPSVIGEARGRGIPVVLTLHDYALICPQGQLLKGGRVACQPPNCVRGNMIHAVLNRCVHDSALVSTVAATEHLVHRALGSYTRRVSRFIAPSRFVAESVAAAGIRRERVALLANGIEPGTEPRPLPGTGGSVLFTGRLAREKGVHDLLEAARRLPDVPFIVAGDGPQRIVQSTAAPPNVTFVGHLDSTALEDLRATAVAIVSPSTWFENAPIAVLEAMRAARPVVATAIGGQPELLAYGGGVLVEPGDVAAPAAAVDRLWRDRTEAAELGRQGRAALVARYGLQRHLDGLLAVYDEVVGRGS